MQRTSIIAESKKKKKLNDQRIELTKTYTAIRIVVTNTYTKRIQFRNKNIQESYTD